MNAQEPFAPSSTDHMIGSDLGADPLAMFGADADAVPYRFRHAFVRLLSERRRGRRFDLYVVHLPVLFGDAHLTPQARDRLGHSVQKIADEMFADKGAAMLSGKDAVVMALPGLATSLADSMARQMGIEVRRFIFGNGKPALQGVLSRLSVWPDGAITRGQLALDAAPAQERKQLSDDELARLARGWTVQYQPIWEVSRRGLTAYRAGMVKENEQGALITPDRLTPEIRARLDGKLLRQSAKHLEGLLRMGKKFDLIVPISAALIGQTSIFADFLRMIAGLPDVIRRHLLLELDVSPYYDDLNQMLQIRQLLQPHCNGLLARTDVDTSAIYAVAKAGWTGCGMDLTGCDLDEASLMMILNQYAESAEQAHMKTFLCGVRTFSITTAAVCAGFHHVDGPAVHQVMGIPNQAMRFDVLDLFARLG